LPGAPSAVGFVVPLYAQLVQGFSALQTAMVLLPFTLVLFVGAIAAAKLATRFAPRRIVFVAQMVEAIGLLILAFTFANQWDTPMLLLGLALVGGQMACFLQYGPPGCAANCHAVCRWSSPAGSGSQSQLARTRCKRTGHWAGALIPPKQSSFTSVYPSRTTLGNQLFACLLPRSTHR